MTTFFHFDKALTREGWRDNVEIAVTDGHISGINANAKRQPDAGHHSIAIPGLPNLHSHSFQRAMSGLAETRGPGTDSFWSWREVMYRFALSMDPDDVEAVAALAFAEMLEGGFTRVGEFHYLHHDKDGTRYADIGELASRIVSASSATGLGLTLLPVFYAHSGFGGQAPNDGQRRFINTLDSYEKLHTRCADIIKPVQGANLGIAPHSLRAVTPEQLTQILPLAKTGPVHIHIAEQMKEVEDCIAWSGHRPVDWLMKNAPVDESWCLIHATHMIETETLAVAKSGAIAGLCPITEANLGDGIFNGPDFIAAGGRYGIGSDSNVLIDAPGELRQLEYSQRLRLRSRNVMTAPNRSTGLQLFESALLGGSVALSQKSFGLEVGAPADFVTLHANHVALAGHSDDTILDALIFGNARHLIDTVWTCGTKRVENGRHLDAARISARYAATIKVLSA